MYDQSRDEEMRRVLFPHLTLEEFRAMRERQRRAFNALPEADQARIRASSRRAQDSSPELAAWAESAKAILKAQRNK